MKNSILSALVVLFLGAGCADSDKKENRTAALKEKTAHRPTLLFRVPAGTRHVQYPKHCQRWKGLLLPLIPVH